MAYAASGLSLIAYGNGASIFAYRSADAIQTIGAPSYFNTAFGQLTAGDRILLLGSTGGNMALGELLVTAVAANSVTTTRPGFCSQSIDLSVTAVADTAYTLTLPACVIYRATTITTTAFTGNTVTNALGTTVGGVGIVAATTIKAAGVFAHTVVAAGAKFAGGTLHGTITQTATFTAVGAARLVVEYVPD